MARRRKNPSGLGIVIGLAAVGGIGYVAYRAWEDIEAGKKKLKGTIAKQKKAIDESFADSTRPTRSNFGFTLANDCIQFVVSDMNKFVATTDMFFRQTRESQPRAESIAGADYFTRRFFWKYFSAMAPKCLYPNAPQERIWGKDWNLPDTLLPVHASVKQQCMYALMFILFAVYLVKEYDETKGLRGWDLQTYVRETDAVVQMLRASGANEDIWDEVFQNTIPMDEKLREALES